MLIQEINLYQERFKEKKLLLSALHMLVVSGVVIAGMLIASGWYQNEITQLQQQGEISQARKTELNARLDMQKKKLAELLDDKQINKKLNQVSADIAARERMIEFISNNQFGSGEGFSENLSGLSRVQISNVWLNEISLAENYVKLSGSALKAENVPEYFNDFQQRRLFNGRVFEVFELQRSKNQDWKVDFVIASRASSNE